MITETFFNYRNYRYLWLNLALLAVLCFIYVADAPLGGPNGGTVLGYTYGGLATAGILYLMWFGIRKRSYHAATTTLKGCLAGHVWLGISLAIIVPLHSGFSFGCNVHTLAYVLMMIVVISGIWGAIQYGSLAPEIQSHRGGATLKKLLEQQLLLSNEIQGLAHQKSDSFLKLLNRVDFTYRPSLLGALFGERPKQVGKKETAELLIGIPAGEQSDALKLIALVDRKHDLISTLMDEAKVMAKLKIWLFLHLPVSFGLLAALAIHIFSVFYYH